MTKETIMISCREFIETFPYFNKDEADDMIEAILADAHCVEHPAGAIILCEGQSCDSMELMLSGEKRVYKSSGNGREITLYEVGPGEICFINASCIMTNTPCPVHAKTLSAVKSLHIPASSFRKLMREYKEIQEFIFSTFSRTFADVVCLLQEVVFKKLDERLIDYLVEKSEDGRLHTTHQQIADDLGTSREVVSRLLKELEQQGEVALSRKCIRLNTL